MISVWAHAITYSVGLEADKALGMADLDGLAQAAKLFEEGGAWACRWAIINEEEEGSGWGRVGGIEMLQLSLRHSVESVPSVAGKYTELHPPHLSTHSQKATL